MKPVVVAKILQGIWAPPIGFITRWTSNNPVVVAKILQGILAPHTGFITRWTSKNQILTNNWNHNFEVASSDAKH